ATTRAAPGTSGSTETPTSRSASWPRPRSPTTSSGAPACARCWSMTAAASASRSTCGGRCTTPGSPPNRRSQRRSRGGCSAGRASRRRRVRWSSGSSAASDGGSADGVRLLHLLAGSLVLRPYVFVFLAVYLFAAVTRLGGRRAAAFTLLAWAVAYAAEFSSTRGGIHFGVPLSNYGGWFLVALVTIGLYQRLDRRVPRSRDGPRHVRYGGLLEPAVYLGILVFNLTLTFWIGETLLGLLGCMLYAPVVVLFLSHPLNPMRRKETTVTYAV